MNEPSREPFDQRGQEMERLKQELAEQVCVAQVGDLAGPLAHECNNYLNVVLLQVAVLELDCPESLRPLLEEIRRQSASFKAVVREFQSYRQRQASPPGPVDLGEVLDAAVEDFNRLPCSPYQFALRTAGKPAPPIPDTQSVIYLDVVRAPNLPTVRTSVPELKRLVLLLLTSLAGTARTNALAVRAEAAPGKVGLRFQDSTPDGPPKKSGAKSAGADEARIGTLAWAAGQALARRLQGKLTEEKRADGGPIFVLQLDANPS